MVFSGLAEFLLGLYEAIRRRGREKPNLEVRVKGWQIARLRQEAGGARADVSFDLVIYNRSTRANTVTDIRVYELARDGGADLLEGKFFLQRVPGYEYTHFDIPAGGSERRAYSNPDQALSDYREDGPYKLRVEVTDRDDKKWRCEMEANAALS